MVIVILILLVVIHILIISSMMVGKTTIEPRSAEMRGGQRLLSDAPGETRLGRKSETPGHSGIGGFMVFDLGVLGVNGVSLGFGGFMVFTGVQGLEVEA